MYHSGFRCSTFWFVTPVEWLRKCLCSFSWRSNAFLRDSVLPGFKYYSVFPSAFGEPVGILSCSTFSLHFHAFGPLLWPSSSLFHWLTCNSLSSCFVLTVRSSVFANTLSGPMRISCDVKYCEDWFCALSSLLVSELLEGPDRANKWQKSLEWMQEEIRS